MDEQILNFTVNEQILTCENPIRISTNKVNYIQASFDLGTNWSGYDSVRAVWFNDFNCISTVLDSLGNCVVPFEVMKRKGNVKVNLVGSISEDDVLTDRLTSYPVVAVIVDCTAQIAGANTSPITPSEFEQFARRVHTDAERAEAGATASEQSAQNASDSATSAHNSAESAHDDKVAIEEAIAEVIQQIEDFEQVQVVVNTLPPSSQATSDFTNGVLTLGIPQGVKGDTGNGIQSITKVSTSGLVDTYRITYTDGQTTTFTVTNGAKGDTGNGIQSIAKTSTVGLVDTYTITYTDGTTTTFTVTNGEKGDKGDTGEVSLSELEDATVVQTLSDNEPYNYRRTNNGNGSGHREYDEIVGASVGWNQLCGVSNAYPTETNRGITRTNNRDGSFTINGTCTQAFAHSLFELGSAVFNHVVLVKFNHSGTFTDILGMVQVIGSGSEKYVDFSTTDYALMRCTPTNATAYRVSLRCRNGGTADNLYVKPNCIDLTLFNSTIADYVLSLEQSTAGSGVAWLKTHFPKLFDTYQPFDSGSIKSVSGLTAHEMVGKNLADTTKWFWNLSYNPNIGATVNTGVGNDVTDNGDGTFSFPNASWRNRAVRVKVEAGQTYYVSGTLTQKNDGFVGWFVTDENDVVISKVSTYGTSTFYSNIVTPPSGAKWLYIQFGDRATGNVTTNVVTEPMVTFGDTALPYEPYTAHSYPLDSSLTLRGVPKLDASNNLYFDGDVYKADGSVSRRYGVVDLGTLTWTKEVASSGHPNWATFYAAPPNAKGMFSVYGTTQVCSKYAQGTTQGTSSDQWVDKTCRFGLTSKNINIADSSLSDLDATAFKQAMSGVYLVYELAAPTTETATPYTNPQWCDSHGTEEYVGSELPVGHNTDYPMSLVDTMPTTNGTFEPRVTVTNGVRTVTWVSV